MGILAGIAFGIQGISAFKSAAQQRKANREQNRLATMENNRRLREAEREARRAEAVTFARSAYQGQLGSTSTVGVLNSITNQLASNIDYMRNSQFLNLSILQARQSQANWELLGQGAQLAGNIAMAYGSTPETTKTTKTVQAGQPSNVYKTFAATPTPSVSSTSIFR